MLEDVQGHRGRTAHSQVLLLNPERDLREWNTGKKAGVGTRGSHQYGGRGRHEIKSTRLECRCFTTDEFCVYS